MSERLCKCGSPVKPGVHHYRKKKNGDIAAYPFYDCITCLAAKQRIRNRRKRAKLPPVIGPKLCKCGEPVRPGVRAKAAYVKKGGQLISYGYSHCYACQSRLSREKYLRKINLHQINGTIGTTTISLNS
jgi:hypothetical protein